ncbi:class I SAM-dependent methyltransferase [Lacticaseibacillus absianus]|uniref:class I SAM-dependent methyltransferase n=1 Tax=Lacticaseibacillus absianus TaxID=2729623 RepID=UPI0015CEBD40|nr:class I SAM-dependent methyltransferase [Lacticaseibacillus absianus]
MDDANSWNDFAAAYAEIQQESRLPVERDVVAQLVTWLPLATLSVADVAAGSGRYALPLTAHARRVELIDWAPAMLAEAKAWLTAHRVTDATYTTADWRALPASPRADLIFISQLPSLTPADLPAVSRLARRAVALNVQTVQTDSLLTHLAQVLQVPTPIAYQADPVRGAALLDALPPTALRQTLTYQLTDAATVTDLLPAFDRPFALHEAQALAQAVSGRPDPNALLPVTMTYTFTLACWPASAFN